MATEYSTRAFPVEPQPAREIAIGVEILRAIDGGDPDLASSFVMRFAPALDDTSIAAAISARVADYVKVDAAQIARGDLAARASSIAASVSDQVISVP